MNSRYKFTHRVARVLARSTQGVPKEYPRGTQGVAKPKDLLSTCQVLAKGMATGLQILLKNKMTRYFLQQQNKLFWCGKCHTLGSKVPSLRHQNNLFCCGANMRSALNTCHLPLYTRILYELTARSQRDYGSFLTRFLRPLDGVWRCERLVVTLLLMLVFGVGGVGTGFLMFFFAGLDIICNFVG